MILFSDSLVSKDIRCSRIVTAGWVIEPNTNITHTYEKIREMASRVLRRKALSHLNHKRQLKVNLFRSQALSFLEASKFKA